jgi:predicted aminopeptidase
MTDRMTVFPRATRFAVVVAAMGLMSGCSPFFVLRAGYEEAKILSRRESIVKLVEDPRTPAERRAKLQLVLAVRQFAEDSLQLNVGKSYTTFSQLDSDTLALVLSAAQQDRFEPYTWWFPIVGRVPYRAYFSERSAQKAVESLQKKGLDAYVRPTSAFSTLGWFNDPLVSPLLRYDSVSLANTVVHELYHNTLYLAGEAMFNESLANFVGARGAIAFFCTKQPDPELCRFAEAAWRDELLFGHYLSNLVDELEALYARADLTSEQKVQDRELVFDRFRQTFEAEVRPQLKVLSFSSVVRAPLNNASLIARRIYYKRLDLFEAAYQASGAELLTTIRRIGEATEGEGDPYDLVDQSVVGGLEESVPISVR